MRRAPPRARGDRLRRDNGAHHQLGPGRPVKTVRRRGATDVPGTLRANCDLWHEVHRHGPLASGVAPGSIHLDPAFVPRSLAIELVDRHPERPTWRHLAV